MVLSISFFIFKGKESIDYHFDKLVIKITNGYGEV